MAQVTRNDPTTEKELWQELEGLGLTPLDTKQQQHRALTYLTDRARWIIKKHQTLKRDTCTYCTEKPPTRAPIILDPWPIITNTRLDQQTLAELTLWLCKDCKKQHNQSYDQTKRRAKQAQKLASRAGAIKEKPKREGDAEDVPTPPQNPEPVPDPGDQED